MSMITTTASVYAATSIADFADFCHALWQEAPRGSWAAAYSIEGWFDDRFGGGTSDRTPSDAEVEAEVVALARMAGLLP